MKYLVMEKANSYAVLLDEDGRFVKSANLGYEIGDTVINPILMFDTPLEKINERSRVTRRFITTFVAIAALVMLVFGINRYQQSVTPYSSIYLAINPEVEMILNKSGDVVQLTGLNEDGQTLIKNYKQNSKDKLIVAKDMVDRAIEMGYLVEGGRVSIAIDTPEAALFEQYGLELSQALDGHDRIVISITDMANWDPGQEAPAEPEIEPKLEPKPDPKPEPKPEPKPDPKPDSDPEPEDNETLKEDSSYDDDSYDEPVESVTPVPTTPKPPVPSKPSIPAPPAPPAPPTKPSVDNRDDTDYDDSDYDDTDYDDSDYDDTDYDDTDYRSSQSFNRNKRNINSFKDNNRNNNGRSSERNSGN